MSDELNGDMSRIHNSNYETVQAYCDNCNTLNTYNRITDLNDAMPIDGCYVKCPSCDSSFWINGDYGGSKFDFWFFFADNFYDQKMYGLYIVIGLTGVEIFFSQAIKLLVDLGTIDNLCKEEILGEECIKKNPKHKHLLFQKMTFVDLRSIFIKLYDKDTEEKIIKERFKIVKKSTVNELRNNVIHKYAYRPTFEDAQKMKELIQAIEVLKYRFNIH